MADLKISQLSSASALAGTEVIPVVQSSATKKATVDQILSPAAGKGINYVASTPAAGKTSQLLNSYEEGTWTPIDASGAGLTFSTASGYYTRVGRLVTVFFTVEYPSTADATAARIGGLPFTVLNDALSPSGGSFHVNTSVSTTAVPAAVQNTTRLLASNPATGGSFTNAELSTGYLRGFVTYMV